MSLAGFVVLVDVRGISTKKCQARVLTKIVTVGNIMANDLTDHEVEEIEAKLFCKPDEIDTITILRLCKALERERMKIRRLREQFTQILGDA
jgi:hypothetical protein